MKIKLPTSVLEDYLVTVAKLEGSNPEAWGMFLADEFDSLFTEGSSLLFADGTKRTVYLAEVATRPGERDVTVWFVGYGDAQAFNIFGHNMTPEGDEPNLPDLDLDALYGNTRESKYHTS